MSQIISKATEVYNAIQIASVGSYEREALEMLFTQIEADVLADYEAGKWSYDDMMNFYAICG